MSYTGGNALLDALSPAERGDLDAAAETVDYRSGDVIFEPGQAIDVVVFPIDCVLSITAKAETAVSIEEFEVAAIGKSSCAGAEIALGQDTSFRGLLVQVDGRAARVPGPVFVNAVARNAAFRAAAYRSLLHRLHFAEQSAACVVAHSLVERASRWVLTVSDYVDRRTFTLRKDFLAMMLGAPISHVESSLEPIAAIGGLRFNDDVITILDPAVLAEVSCSCYELLKQI